MKDFIIILAVLAAHVYVSTDENSRAVTSDPVVAAGQPTRTAP